MKNGVLVHTPLPSVAEDLGSGGGEAVEVDGETRVLGEMLSGGVGEVRKF